MELIKWLLHENFERQKKEMYEWNVGRISFDQDLVFMIVENIFINYGYYS